MTKEHPYRRTNFYGGWFENDAGWLAPIPGYTDDTTWNGFLRPLFTRETIDATVAANDGRLAPYNVAIFFVQHHNSYLRVETPSGEALPDGLTKEMALALFEASPTNDAFVMAKFDGAKIYIILEMYRDIIVDGQPITGYAIGADAWCWEEAPLEPLNADGSPIP